MHLQKRVFKPSYGFVYVGCQYPFYDIIKHVCTPNIASNFILRSPSEPCSISHKRSILEPGWSLSRPDHSFHVC